MIFHQNREEQTVVYRASGALIGVLRRFAPLIVVSAMLLLSAAIAYQAQGFGNGPGISGFALISRHHARELKISSVALTSNSQGYDGQFYYLLVVHPSLLVTCVNGWKDPVSACPIDTPPLRFERIGYPMLAWLASLGQPILAPFALLLVNFLAILATAVIVGQLCVEAGASRWLGAAAGLFCGEISGFLRDLADPVAVLLLVVAVALFRRERWLAGSLALAAALLTREQIVVCLPFLLLPLLAQRRWLLLAQSATLALLPFAAWQIVLKALYGVWPLTGVDTGAAQLDYVPFLGLWVARAGPNFWFIVLGVAIPLTCAAAVALLALRRQSARGMMTDPLPLLVFCYALLLSLTYWFQWSDLWGPSRLAAPVVVLAVIVAARLPQPGWRHYYGLLLTATYFVPLYMFLR